MISYVNSNNQLEGVFTKLLRVFGISYICNKFDAYDLYAPLWGGLLELLYMTYDFEGTILFSM